MSKVFERLIMKQIEPFINTWLSKYLCGFRKNHSCQYALLNMLRKWQSTLNTSGIVGSILMDLSKAFDCLPHELLIAKLHAYGFGKRSLNLFYSYLSNRFHRVRIGSSISEFLELLLGVPQGSVLGPILFNIFINDLLSLVQEDICNFADDNTLYVCGNDVSDVKHRLKSDLDLVLNWFTNNGMVANPEKFQAIFLGTKDSNINIEIGTNVITSSKEVKLLGVTIDRQLSFFPHVSQICRKASAKTKALRRIRSYLTQNQADLLFSSFIMSPFNYCPLVWMFCSKHAGNRINATHHKALCVLFNNFSDTFDELLLKSNSITIHSKNLKLLVGEVFKTLNRLSPEITWDTFTPKWSRYDLRQGSSLAVPRARTTRAINSFDFRAALAWNSLPKQVKAEKNLVKFYHGIKDSNIYCKCLNCQ